MTFAIAAAVTAAALNPSSTAPQPKPLNENAWILPEDYPAPAMRGAEEGRVAFRLAVDTTGAVIDCAVTASSGSALLDVHTCDLMRLRARFEPARDDSGRAIAGEYSSTVDWTLPDGPAYDISQEAPADVSTIDIQVGSNGRVTQCKVVELAGSASNGLDPCIKYPNGSRYSDPTTRDGRPIGSQVRITNIVTRIADHP